VLSGPIQNQTRPSARIQAGLRRAQYELMENGRYYGSIPQCEEVWGEAATLEGCREEGCLGFAVKRAKFSLASF
jgi:hypothetical protein